MKVLIIEYLGLKSLVNTSDLLGYNFRYIFTIMLQLAVE